MSGDCPEPSPVTRQPTIGLCRGDCLTSVANGRGHSARNRMNPLEGGAGLDHILHKIARTARILPRSGGRPRFSNARRRSSASRRPVRPGDPGGALQRHRRFDAARSGSLRLRPAEPPQPRCAGKEPVRLRLLVASRGRQPIGYAVVLTRRGSRRRAALFDRGRAPRRPGAASDRAFSRQPRMRPAARSADRMHLEVRADNPAAIAFYERAGYRPIGQRPGYYEDGMTALLFARHLAAQRPPPPPRRLAGPRRIPATDHGQLGSCRRSASRPRRARPAARHRLVGGLRGAALHVRRRAAEDHHPGALLQLSDRRLLLRAARRGARPPRHAERRDDARPPEPHTLPARPPGARGSPEPRPQGPAGRPAELALRRLRTVRDAGLRALFAAALRLVPRPDADRDLQGERLALRSRRSS